MSSDQITINNLSKVYDNGFNALKNDDFYAKSKFVIMSCPWCSAEIGKIDNHESAIIIDASD